MHINVTIDIAASPERIWAYIRQIGTHHEWIHDATDITFVGSQTEGVGTTFDVETRFGPLHLTDHMVITEWVAAEVMGVDHSGLVKGAGRFTLEALGNRTTFRWIEDLHFPLRLGGRAGEMIARPLLRTMWKRNLRGLKRRIERGAGQGTERSEREPGALIGLGRDCDIREFGPGQVIRTSRSGSNLRSEVSLMQHLAKHGYPVPTIHPYDDDQSMVMDRIDGPTMMADMVARPWRVYDHARTLADLHARLREISPPKGMKQLGHGKELLHMDLHPENIILSEDGPIVIDWTNAAVGVGDLDAALTWVIIKTGAISANGLIKPLLELLRERFVKQFERSIGEDRIRANATAAAELRLLDRNLLTSERDEVFRLARRLQDRPMHSRTDDA